MFRKLFLIFNTVRFLKTRQIFYQVYYRLKQPHNLDSYKKAIRHEINPSFLEFSFDCPAGEMVHPDGTFIFLNLKKKFENGTDWDYQGHGKLWNYNLQYLNYLHQQTLSDEARLSYLDDIGKWLSDGRLKLEPYPVSLRVMNTIRYLSEIKINLPGTIRDTYAQIAYLEQYIEYHLMGNHVLENSFALMMGGGFFNNKDWQQKAKKLLAAELNEQILNDGAHFELSPMYHQIILFRVLELIDWYRNVADRDMAFLAFMEEKAVRMLTWLNNITFENDDIPHFNDSADGIACTSAQLLNFAASLGLTGNLLPALSESGYRKFIGQLYECVVDAGPVGPSYQPGHGHSDALSFVLYAAGFPLIVDTGTSTYQTGEKRSNERATAAHNTVVIGGKNQSQVWGGFRVGKRAEVSIIQDMDTLLTASHDGYVRNFGVTHQRDFIFKQGSISINDKIINGEGLLSQSFLHFHPDCKVSRGADNLIIIDNIAQISFEGAKKVQLDKYQYTAGFNLYRDAICLVADFYDECSIEIKFLQDR